MLGAWRVGIAAREDACSEPVGIALNPPDAGLRNQVQCTGTGSAGEFAQDLVWGRVG